MASASRYCTVLPCGQKDHEKMTKGVFQTFCWDVLCDAFLPKRKKVLNQTKIDIKFMSYISAFTKLA